MPWIVSFEIFGEAFAPSLVPFNFSEQQDPGDIGTTGKFKGRPLPYGSASYRVPADVENADRIKHLVAVVKPLLAAIREAGATEWHVSIGRVFDGQCNEEYSQEELLLIASLQCGLVYSAYESSENEEMQL